MRLAGRLLAALVSTTVMTTSGISLAAQYPSKPVRLVIGFPPGGAADIIARIMSQRLSELWGQQIVIDNRPGAGGMLGGEIVSKAAADGYTLLMASSSHAAGAGLYNKLSFDPVKSFSPISLVASAPQVLLANNELPAKTIGELVSAAKANPGKLNFGSAGNGSTTHLAGELFKSMARVNIVHVPYKGGAPALTDLMGGQIQLLFLSLPPASAQIKADRVRALAVTSAKRSKLLPQVPSIAESIPGYEATNWYAVLAPAGLRGALVRQINSQMVEVLRTKDVADAIARQGAQPVGSSPEQFESYLKSEIAKWTKVIRETGIRAN